MQGSRDLYAKISFSDVLKPTAIYYTACLYPTCQNINHSSPVCVGVRVCACECVYQSFHRRIVAYKYVYRYINSFHGSEQM